MKKKQRKRLLAVLAAAAVLTSALFLALLLHRRHEETAEEERVYATVNVELESAGGIPVYHRYIPVDSPRRPGEIRAIKYVTIHETDNRGAGATAEAHNVWITGDVMDITSWHYTVDDHSIYHNLPDNEVAWNAGDNRERDGGNINGIGVEMCVNLGGDYEQVLVNTAALTAELLYVYDLTPDDVRMHADFMDKVCPHRLITEGRVDDFKDMIRKDYEQIVRERTEEEGQNDGKEG